MMKILTETHQLLARANENLVDIAANAALSKDWLSRFKNGAIPNPGIRNLQVLNDYLKQPGKTGRKQA